MRTRLLLLLWIAFWTGLSLRHVPPRVAPKVAVPQRPAWPSPELWQQLLDRRPSSFAYSPGGGDRPHQGWTPQRLRENPNLLRHVEVCHLEEVSTLPQLATGRKRLTSSTRYYSHPLTDARLSPAELAAYELLLISLEPEPREALEKALNRINPLRTKQLLEQAERPNSPDWWLDAEALSRQGSRRGLEMILASPSPEVGSLAPVLEWLGAPENANLWKAALKVALQGGPAQPWASARLLQFGPEALRICAYLELNRHNFFWLQSTEPAAGQEEWGWRWVAKGSPSPEAQRVVSGMLRLRWSPERQRQGRRLVLDDRWPSSLRRSVAAKLLKENPANLAPEWLKLWPDLWSDLPVSYGEGPAYQKALAELDRSHCYQGTIPERLWLAGRLTPARAKKAMRKFSNFSQVETPLESVLREEIPSGLLAQLLGEDDDSEWNSPFWPSLKEDALIDRALLARLGRGKFRDYFTMESLFRPEARFDPVELAAIREQGGGPAGVASALLGKVELEGGDANFLACHLVAHLYLKHENLPVAHVWELQDGAPARLFQAAQAYLEASPDPLAAQLLKKRGGRVLLIEGQASCRWLEWLPALRREALQRQTPILAWSDLDEVRSEVRGNQLRVIRGAETRIRQLTDRELAFLRHIQKPALSKPYTGYASHFQTLVYLAPQGGWALSLATLPPGHPGRSWGQSLWEISQKPAGTVTWSFAADFPQVETLAYYPEESFEAIGLSQGRPVLKTGQGWCDLQLKPCPAPPAPQRSGWKTDSYTSGFMETTRLDRMDSNDKVSWSYQFSGLRFDNFCVEGRELYFEARGRVVHVTLPAEASAGW